MSEQTTPEPEQSGPAPEESAPVEPAPADAGAGEAGPVDAGLGEVVGAAAAGGSPEGAAVEDIEPDDAEPAPESSDVPLWRKVPLWGWVAAGAVVVAGIVVGVLAGTGAFAPAPLPTPPAETVTAAPPRPTVEPVAREGEATPFSAALPDTVLDLALADFVAGGRFDDINPLESYTLVYSDGGSRSVTVYAAQFPDAEAAQAAMPTVMDDGIETGEVTAGGVVVGEYIGVGLDDYSGELSMMWRNSTALFVVAGDEPLIRDVFTAFPL